MNRAGDLVFILQPKFEGAGVGDQGWGSEWWSRSSSVLSATIRRCWGRGGFLNSCGALRVKGVEVVVMVVGPWAVSANNW